MEPERFLGGGYAQKSFKPAAPAIHRPGVLAFLFRGTRVKILQLGKRPPKSGVIGNEFFVENLDKRTGGALWLKALFWLIGQIKVGAQ